MKATDIIPDPIEKRREQFWKNAGHYLLNIIIAFDQLVNTVFGGAPDETISGRAGRAAKKNILWGKILSWFLNHVQKGHTDMAIINDEKGRHDEAIDLGEGDDIR